MKNKDAYIPTTVAGLIAVAFISFFREQLGDGGIWLAMILCAGLTLSFLVWLSLAILVRMRRGKSFAEAAEDLGMRV